MLLCPVCKENIIKNEKNYQCKNNHLFDISKYGYVNFLLNARAKLPGDNKIMVQARYEFLKKGYYNKLAESLIEIIDEVNPKTIVDAGCGEGYYTNAIYKSNRKIFGFDISKSALCLASKKNIKINFIVASIFYLPIIDNSIDLLMNIFAPYGGDEFHRILKDHGKMIVVVPSENHLFQLKQLIYEKPYKNEVKKHDLERFKFLKSKKISYEIELLAPQDLDNLFKMTPYYYRTKKEDYEKILTINHFKTMVEFEILLYEKN